MKTILLKNVPIVKKGDNIGRILSDSILEQGLEINNTDVVLIAQSIISKAKGNVINLKNIDPGDRAEKISKKTGKDPKIVEAILQNSEKIIEMDDSIITETPHGFICADAGIDSSNVEKGKVTTLPENPDEIATEIRQELYKNTGKKLIAIITDTWGRPFRLGALGFAIGISGTSPIKDQRGKKDIYGKELKTSQTCPADALAAIGSLLMGEANEKTPAVIVKDPPIEEGSGSIQELLREKEKDLFR